MLVSTNLTLVEWLSFVVSIITILASFAQSYLSTVDVYISHVGSKEYMCPFRPSEL